MQLQPVDYLDAPATYDPEWLVEGFWQRGSVNFISGSPKAHKSNLRRYLLACSLASQPAFGRFATTPFERALLLFIEDHLGMERQQTDKVFEQFGLAEPVHRGQILLARRLGFDLTKRSHLDHLHEFLTERSIDLLLIDPLVHFHSAKENETDEVARLVQGLRWLAEVATVVVVHHRPKPPENSSSESRRTPGENLRGSSVFGGAADATVEVTRHRKTVVHDIRRDLKSGDDQEELRVAYDWETGLWEVDQPLTLSAVREAIAACPAPRKTIARRLARRDEDVNHLIDQLITKGEAFTDRAGRKTVVALTNP